MTVSAAREMVNGLEMDVSDQSNVSQSASASRRSNNKQHVRHRASIACFSCRDRRIRCVVPKGASACTQCKRSGTRCVIKMDDERRRPISKAYVSSLSTRISLLESMLREHGVVIPPAAHPPMTKHEAQSAAPGDETRIPNADGRGWSQSDANSPTRHVLSPPDSHHDFTMQESPMEGGLVSNDVTNLESEPLRKELSPFQALNNTKHGDSVHQLLRSGDWLSYDRLLGKLRFLSPAANCHASPDRYDLRETPEQVRRAERIIRSLPPKTHDYLMQNFWNFHNNVLQVVDRAAFEADRGSETPRFYSSFLHVIILAVGWQFADSDRCDIARINLGNRESTLHREARYMLDLELERTMGIPSVQALLLLGDLECGVGRDNIGRMYAGMANRLAFDIGLHLDCSNVGLPKHEVSIHRRVMKACILQDKYWALVLGRPTSIKSQDIAWDLLKPSSSAVRTFEHGQGVPIDAQIIDEEIYEQLFELMDLAGRVVEGQEKTKQSNVGNQQTTPFDTDETENNISAQTPKLDQQLQDWYERLPSHLTWNPNNIRTAPSSYFFLHEQYYATMILLHRSRESHTSAASDKLNPKSPPSLGDVMDASETEYDFASHQEPNSQDTAPQNSSDSARGICTQAAVQLAQAISQYKQRFDVEKICWTNLQPAGTASMVLLAAIAHSKNEAERRSYQSCLKVVLGAICGMSRHYQPAARMGNLIHSLLAQLHVDAREQDSGTPFEQRTNGSKDGATAQYQEPNAFAYQPGRRERDQIPRTSRRPQAMPVQFTSESAQQPPQFQIPPNPSYPQQPYANQPPSTVPSLFTQPPAPSDGFFNLDSLWNAAVSTDNGSYATRPSSDTYLRVAPSAKGWALQSLHASQLAHVGPAAAYDSHMADWVPGFNGAAGFHEPALGGKEAWGCKREDVGGLVWMGGASSHPEPEGDGAAAAAVAPRKHELDFLSL
ncbi:fungal-specific transcription factor domain-containing protein [Xylaria intraflava]|nr:fungal-specific transcription factor domain-containing protein [Xylaria intraflava]